MCESEEPQLTNTTNRVDIDPETFEEYETVEGVDQDGNQVTIIE